MPSSVRPRHDRSIDYEAAQKHITHVPQRAANGLRSLTVIHTKYLLIRLFWKVSAVGTTRATGGKGIHQNEWNLIHAPDGGHV